MPKASVIIRCYNEEEHIGRLLVGISTQTLADIEIIVVDSGSTDGTVEVARRFPVKLVTIRPEEFSFGRSLNRGCAAAAGEILVIASAHVYPTHDDWLERLVRPFDDPAVALVYGGQRGDASSRYSEGRLLRRWFPDRSDPDQRHPFCNNANAAVRRSLWQKMPYDEGLTGLEDLDWGRRAMQQGHRIVYDAEAVVIHLHHETPSRVYNRYRREALAMRRVMPEVRFGLLDFARLFIGNVVSDLYHAALDGELRRAWEVVWFRFMQFWGTYRGHRFHGEVTSALKKTFYYPSGLGRAPLAEPADRARRRIDYTSPSMQGGQPAALQFASARGTHDQDRGSGADAA